MTGMNASRHLHGSRTPILLFVSLLSVSLIGGCSPPALFEQECGSLASASDEAVLPTGMRRTKNGWEDATYWHISTDIRRQTIDSLMAQQAQREPEWVRSLFERIRMTPPLMIAVMQIAAIAAIVHIGRSKQQDQAS